MIDDGHRRHAHTLAPCSICDSAFYGSTSATDYLMSPRACFRVSHKSALFEAQSFACLQLHHQARRPEANDLYHNSPVSSMASVALESTITDRQQTQSRRSRNHSSFCPSTRVFPYGVSVQVSPHSTTRCYTTLPGCWHRRRGQITVSQPPYGLHMLLPTTRCYVSLPSCLHLRRGQAAASLFRCRHELTLLASRCHNTLPVC